MLVGCSSAAKSSNQTAGSGGKQEPVTFRVVSFLDNNHPFTKDIIPMWMTKMEEATNGAVKFEWIGGPESIPIEEQFNAVRNGIAEVGFNTSSYYAHLMPETLSLHLSPYTPEEERNNGYFKYLDDRFTEQGVTYIGRWLGPSPFYLWSNSEIKKLDDLVGLSFRSNPTYQDILEALDVQPVTVTPSDVYTSLERKMVDGFGFPLLGPKTPGWTEVTNYIIDEPFLNQNGTILINDLAFQELSDDLQEAILTATAEFEKEMYIYFNERNEEEWISIQAEGVEKISLSSDESEKFQGIVQQVYWDTLEKDAPDEVEILKELLMQ